MRREVDELFQRILKGTVENVSGNSVDQSKEAKSYPSIPSHVPKIVQLKPRIDRIPKFRCGEIGQSL